MSIRKRPDLLTRVLLGICLGAFVGLIEIQFYDFSFRHIVAGATAGAVGFGILSIAPAWFFSSIPHKLIGGAFAGTFAALIWRHITSPLDIPLTFSVFIGILLALAFFLTESISQGLSHISLRKAVESDFDFTFTVKEEALRIYIDKTYGPWNEEWQLKEHRKDFSSGSLDIIINGALSVGYTYIRRTEKAINLVDICLLPEFQGNGIGTYIIKGLLSEAKALKVPVELGVFKINSSALKLYRKLGFAQVSETPTHILLRSK